MDELDPAFEWKLRAAAIPAALVVALAFHAWPTGHFLQRTFLTMMVHELGHAVTGWWCGFAALPTLWRTAIPEARGVIVPLLVALGEAAIIYRGLKDERRWLAGAGAVLIALQLAGTFALSADQAHATIIFGGDGGAMVLGTLLMACFFVPRLRKGGLRWGLLAIGAAAFVDTFATWWTARTNRDVIPFGEIEGVGLSDPSKLTETYGWHTGQMIARYVTLGVACLVALAALWAWQTWRLRATTRPAPGP